MEHEREGGGSKEQREGGREREGRDGRDGVTEGQREQEGLGEGREYWRKGGRGEGGTG